MRNPFSFLRKIKDSAITIKKTLTSEETIKQDDGSYKTETVTQEVSSISPPIDNSRKKVKAKASVLITSPSDLYLDKCKVNMDHSISYNLDRKKLNADMLRSPHLLTFNIRQFIPSIFARFILRIMGIKYARTLVYAVQFDGEVTHDPHLDNLDEEMKLRHESLLGIKGTIAKADIANNIQTGMKQKKKWDDYIPYFVIIGIVFLFLFAFQIQPNL